MNESEEIGKRLVEMNEIFDELIKDALGLSKDLVDSIKQWMLSSAFWFLAAMLWIWFVFYPLLVSGSFWDLYFYLDGFIVFGLLFLGCVSIWKYRVLKNRYAGLFAIQEALEKEK